MSAPGRPKRELLPFRHAAAARKPVDVANDWRR